MGISKQDSENMSRPNVVNSAVSIMIQEKKSEVERIQ